MDEKKYWNEIAGKGYAHLIPERGRDLKKDSDVLKVYTSQFLNDLEFKGKHLLEYGIGGGFLPLYLFENRRLNKYTGIDIAQRSLNVAKKTLDNYSDKCSFYLAPTDFSQFKADIFITLACIQHFPSEEYLDTFLKNLNNSKITDIVLQIRNNKNTLFNNAYYGKEIGNVGLACQTNPDYISNHLFKYRKKYESSVMEGSRYQYIIYKKVE